MRNTLVSGVARYVTCVSTFAMILKLPARREALYLVVLSIGETLAVAAPVR